MHAAVVAQDHHDVQLAGFGAVYGYQDGRIDHSFASVLLLLQHNQRKQRARSACAKRASFLFQVSGFWFLVSTVSR
jgi:hypothetical protein